MKWSSALSEEADLTRAVDQLAATVLDDLGQAPDLAFLFASGHHRIAFDRLPGMLRERLRGVRLMGCSASGVIGAESEVEQAPAIGLAAACLPDVVIDCWRLEADDLAPGSAHSARVAALAANSAGPPQLLVLADPFTFPTERLLRSLEHAFTESRIVGGLASGGNAPGECVLFEDDRLWYSGALLVALSGNIEMHCTVAQGCRPIGDPMFVSRCEGNRIAALDGRPPHAVLNELFAHASPDDRRLMQHSLFLGLAMRPGESRYEQGDFLIRNVLGGDPESGALWVGAELHERQVVQFHLRDAATSAEDLDHALARLHESLGSAAAMGGLLFSCTGRGAGLYGAAGHDSAACRRHLGALPLGGFFCNGEIGQVAGLPFVHGYTSAIAVFTPRSG